LATPWGLGLLSHTTRTFWARTETRIGDPLIPLPPLRRSQSGWPRESDEVTVTCRESDEAELARMAVTDVQLRPRRGVDERKRPMADGGPKAVRGAG